MLADSKRIGGVDMKETKTLTFIVLLLIAFAASVPAQKLKAEDVVSKHLDSLGTAESRTAIKTRVAVGDATAKFISSKNQIVQGRVVFASEGTKNFIGMNMNSTLYLGERFSYDGKNANVAFVQLNNRSILGNFVQSYDFMLTESTLGGTLASSWVLLQMAGNKGKLSSDGIRKIDGREYYVLGYTKKGGGDLDVAFYFDKETFRHTRTEYKRTSSARIGLTPEASSGFSETKYKITEDFSDFKAENGLTLPRKYRLFYSTTGEQGTTEVEWSFVINEIAFNHTLDPKTFDAPAK